MRNLRRLAGAALAALALAGPVQAQAPAQAPAQVPDRAPDRAPGGFDFYVLALSWSPSWCREHGDDRSAAQQCRTGKPHGFVVHGLWPQHERGYPADCVASPPRLDDGLIRGMLDLMPSFGLVIHQWRKHGTCSGLAPDDYFALVRRAHGKVRIPAEFHDPDRARDMAPIEIENAFIRENEGLARDMIAVDCGKRLLREVRVCLSPDLAFRPCPEVDRRACRGGRLEIPPVRGG